MGPFSLVQSWKSHLELDEKLTIMCLKKVKMYFFLIIFHPIFNLPYSYPKKHAISAQIDCKYHHYIINIS